MLFIRGKKNTRKLISFCLWLLCLGSLIFNNIDNTAQAASRGLQNANPKWLPVAALYPAGEKPDQIILSWTEDPSTSQFISWRTSGAVKDGLVQFRELRAQGNTFTKRTAYYVDVKISELSNAPCSRRFFVKLDGLKPNTAYEYQVGSSSANAWSPMYKFITAPVFGTPFSFVYLGDIQTDYELFGEMLESIESRFHNIAFYLQAGDLVDDGENCNQWDVMLDTAKSLTPFKIMASTMGNHDSHYVNDADKTLLFAEYLHQPHNGPESLPRHHAYSFTYSNAYFIVLNTNDDTDQQTPWLINQLEEAKLKEYQWIIVMFHHPVYSTHVKRWKLTLDLQEKWAPLFDQYGIDLVLTGHDHVYMRTGKITNHVPAKNGESGTIYVIANSSTKNYETRETPQALLQITGVPTFQKLDVFTDQSGKQVLHYVAYNKQCEIVDEFRLEK